MEEPDEARRWFRFSAPAAGQTRVSVAQAVEPGPISAQRQPDSRTTGWESHYRQGVEQRWITVKKCTGARKRRSGGGDHSTYDGERTRTTPAHRCRRP